MPQIILSSPYTAPTRHHHWNHATQSYEIKPHRRPAGYTLARLDKGKETSETRRLALAESLRAKVQEWRAKGHPGTTRPTQALLAHWTAKNRSKRLFFCQLEAVETLIYLTEIEPMDGLPRGEAPFPRYCAKMATGTGKTTAMAMTLLWQAWNHFENPRRDEFTGKFLIVAPGITVKERLAVLLPGGGQSPYAPEASRALQRAATDYYTLWDLIPPEMPAEALTAARIVLINRHRLPAEAKTDRKPRKGVFQPGPKPHSASLRGLLGGPGKDWIVFNDEAHHAYDGNDWMTGLGIVHGERRIRACYDFTATPFPATQASRSSKGGGTERIFPWIVSDFGLNDAIESGLVKTPRAVSHDDSKSGLGHLYRDPAVEADLNRKDAGDEDPLPDAVTAAYRLLGESYRKTGARWAKAGKAGPPVLFTTANTQRTANRIHHAFAKGRFPIHEALRDPKAEEILLIHSKALDKAEKGEGKGADENLRQRVKTVGVPGHPGAPVRNVISVNMLAEGWDAKNVTQILGLRAFQSQLLCEQVIGRGLRRTRNAFPAGDELPTPEYVDVMGVPVKFLLQELPAVKGEEPGTAVHQEPAAEVRVLPGREPLRIGWPNILAIRAPAAPVLRLDPGKIERLVIPADRTATFTDMGALKAGRTSQDEGERHDVRDAGPRLQTLAFHQAQSLYETAGFEWRDAPIGRGNWIAQTAKLVLDALEHPDWLRFDPEISREDGESWLAHVGQNMGLIQQHLVKHMEIHSAPRLEVEQDPRKKHCSTADMTPWETRRPVHEAVKSQISHCVCDSGWERKTAEALDHAASVQAWAKNDHLDLQIPYSFENRLHRYRPDFLIRRTDGSHHLMEVKGKDSPRTAAKHEAARRWAQAAGWGFVVCRSVEEVRAWLGQEPTIKR